MGGLSQGTCGLLLAFGLAAGVGITAIGPGGVLVTLGLFAFSGLPPAEVAGTAIVTHVATGLLGSGVYLRSGQLRAKGTRRMAWILACAAVVGTPLGIWAATVISAREFGLVLAVLVAGTGLAVWRRQSRHGAELPSTSGGQVLRTELLVAIGVGVGAVSGLFGIGGPMLTVPLLMAFGAEPLPALAAAQVQSVVIASVGTAGYLFHGDVSWGLAFLVGLPELVGVVIGWKLARSVSSRTLGYALASALLLLAPYLAVRSFHGSAARPAQLSRPFR